MKLLQENTGMHLYQLRPGKSLFEMTSKAQGTERKYHLDFKLKTFVHQRMRESEKTTDRMGENICKSYLRQVACI